MTRCLCCGCLGILAVGVLPGLPGSSWSPVIVVAAVLMLCLIGIGPGSLIRSVACFVLGLCWSALVCRGLLDSRVPDHWTGDSIWIEGEVIGLPRIAPDSIRFVLQVQRAEPCGLAPDTLTPYECKKRFRIRLSYYLADQELLRIRPGEIWRLQVKLRPPRGLTNKGAFSYEAWLLRNNIGATGYVQPGFSQVKLAGHGSRQRLQQVRFMLREFIADSLHHSEYRGLLLALALGENQQISHRHWDVLSRSGTNHLLIISGLHVSLVIGLAYRLFNGLSVWLMPGLIGRRVAVIATALTGFGYAGIAGFGLPVQRSLIMALVVFASMLLGRAVKTRNVFLWALLAVTASDPLAAYSTGFWLSFCAVMILLFLFSGRYRVSKLRYGLLVEGVSAQMGIFLGMFTCTAYLLLQVSVISPLANIIAIPVISLIVVPVVLFAIGSWFMIGDSAGLLLHLAAQVVGYLWVYLELLADLNLVWIPLGFSATAAVLGMLGGLLMLTPAGLPGRWLSICLVLPFLLPAPDQLIPGQLHLRILDVGQGLSVLLQTRNHSLIYDLGAKRGERFDMGELVVIPALRLEGIRNLHKAVISNGDNDHAGGTNALMDKVLVLDIISGDPAGVRAATGIHRHIKRCAAGSRWSWDDVQFEFLHPDVSRPWQGNDLSCVLLVTTGKTRVLIPGDISNLVEPTLAEFIQEPIDLLVVPHHGSDSSSSPGFLNRLQPDYAIISAGYRNRFGHPRKSVLDRYVNRGVKLFTTYSDGAVLVDMDPSGIRSISAERHSTRKFWFEQ